DDRVVVGGVAVGADDHGIADDLALKAHLAADRVGEDDVVLVGHAKADRRTLASGHPRGGLRLRQPAAGAGVVGRASGRQGLLTLGLELRGRTEAVIRLVRSQQLGGVRRVEMQPLRLPVRTMRTVDVGTLVPVEAQPAQVAGDRGFRLTRRSLGVRVLEPQDEPAALAAREQPVEERGTRIADVQLPGRTRCEPDSHALRTNAMAWAAIASPRPIASIPSFVFPLM